jgi:beta-lactamase class A
MVAAAFHDDPLAHPDGVRNKTGTDDGVRADGGYRGDLAYAVLANWDPAAGDRTAEVVEAMRSILID